MYICDKCGEKHIKELPIYTEYVKIGVSHSIPVDEYYLDNCSCGGTFQDALKCPVCGEYYLGEKGCCENCYEELATKENCIQTEGEGWSNLNWFLSFVFTESEINEILEREFDKLDENLKKQFQKRFADHVCQYQGEDYFFVEQCLERRKCSDIHKRNDKE